MPEIARFGSFIVGMFFEDHAPARVHVVGPDHKAKVRIADGEVFHGSLPPRIAGTVKTWIVENRPALMERWRRYGGQ